MGKHFEELIFFIIIGWFVWVIIGSNGEVRMERGCSPVQWGGDAIASVARAIGTDYGTKAQIATNTVDYHCQQALWDFFYRSQWEKQHPGQPVPGSSKPAQKSASSTSLSTSSTSLTQSAAS